MARSPDGGEETRRAAEWLDALPPPTIPESGTLAGPEPVVLREAPPENSAVHYDGELIGWVERFGPSRQGSLTLTPDALTFRPDAGDEPLVLPVAELTAIQPASSSLQLGLRGRVVSLRFPGSSILRWEMLLQTAVKRLWATKGRGEVLDFQPRIVAR